MIYLAIIPWILTVAALLFIMTKRNNDEDSFDEDFDGEDDLFMDEERETVRVAVYDDKAYWVYDNVFYESDVVREPDFTTARPIDTMDLPANKLNELLAILDELEQNKNERE